MACAWPCGLLAAATAQLLNRGHARSALRTLRADGPDRSAANYAGRNGGLYQWTQTNEEIKFAGPVSAQGQIIPSPRSGVQLDVTLGSTAQFGYQPVRVTATLPRPATADRQIRFQFSAGGWGRDNHAHDRHAIVHDQARRHHGVGRRCSFRSTRIGKRARGGCGSTEQPDDDLSTEEVATSQQRINAGVCVLLASADYGSSRQHQFARRQWECAPAIARSAFRKLPVDWKRYSTGRPGGAHRRSGVRRFSRNSFPTRTARLLRWVRAGGNLWLIDAGQTWAELAVGRDGARAVCRQRRRCGRRRRRRRGDSRPRLAVRRAERERAAAGRGRAHACRGSPSKKTRTTHRNPRPRRAAGAARRSSSKRRKQWFAVRGLGLGVIAAFRGALDDDSGGTPGAANAARRSGRSNPFSPAREAAYGLADPSLEPVHGPVPPVAAAIQRSLLMPRLGLGDAARQQARRGERRVQQLADPRRRRGARRAVSVSHHAVRAGDRPAELLVAQTPQEAADADRDRADRGRGGDAAAVVRTACWPTASACACGRAA